MTKSKTAKSAKCILLFEDEPALGKKRQLSIQKAVGKNIPVRLFENPAPSASPKESNFEQALRDFVGHKLIEDYVGLIVADQELTQYSNLRPASGETITAYAQSTGIPLCLYERGQSHEPSALSITRWKKWGKGRIILDESSHEFGRDCASLYHGFELIDLLVHKFGAKDTTPGQLLAKILERPELSDRISQYGAGEQGILEEIISFYEEASDSGSAGTTAILKRYPKVLGQWLLTSLLRFPGILMDQKTFAAYLRLDQSALDNKRVKKTFAKAEYEGPFCEINRWWWRDSVDEILRTIGVDNAEAYASSKANGALPKSICRETAEGGQHSAGYICMISGDHVCDKHSRGGISWFPAGADLARISTREYRKVGPFIGMY